MRPAVPIVLHGSAVSGHTHRAMLLLRMLGLPCTFRAVDLKAGEHKSPDFLRLNPFGTVPVLDDGGVVVADSSAILVYLALRYDAARIWLPADPAAAAEVQRWLSVAQGPLFNGPNAARLAAVFGRPIDVAAAKAVAAGLLPVMDGHLAGRPFLAGAGPTIADLANYAYVAHAPEGGIALDPYPHVLAWLGRVEALPGFEPMPRLAPAS